MTLTLTAETFVRDHGCAVARPGLRRNPRRGRIDGYPVYGRYPDDVIRRAISLGLKRHHQAVLRGARPIPHSGR